MGGWVGPPKNYPLHRRTETGLAPRDHLYLKIRLQ